MNDELNHAPHLIAAVAGMIRHVKDHFAVDWTIPATWIVGLVVLGLSQVIFIGWTASAMVTRFEQHEKHQAQRDDAADQETKRIRDRQAVNEEHIAQHGQQIVGVAQMISGHETRIQYLERVELHEEKHLKGIHGK